MQELVQETVCSVRSESLDAKSSLEYGSSLLASTTYQSADLSVVPQYGRISR